MAYRSLTKTEIALLESRGCTAENWQTVAVAAEFMVGRGFHQVRFSGTVEMGVFNGNIQVAEGFALPAGISHAVLHNVRVGDNCCIRYASIANTDIGAHVLLEYVDCVARLGDSPFANLCAVNVLAEDGGRSVPLWRHLTAQTAHLLCHYKNHPAARAVETLIRQDAESLRLPRCVINAESRIRQTGPLRNVWIGENTRIEGAARLENCYIDGSADSFVHIGDNVDAEDCIFLPSATVSGGVRLERCLVGEGVHLSGGFAGKHTLFFANSEFSLGESDAVIAGPFAASHHKATLILTCQTSFSTFGSGSNSSNHHFKLGPRHGGVMRRGVKCGSGSYLFWPCDIGAFTTVVGRHSGHMETAHFPFSLLVADGKKSILVPGVNAFSAGGYRDERKWRERDKRKGIAMPHDLVNPAVLSPYVIQAMDTGVEFLRRCLGVDTDVRHSGAIIPAARIAPALLLYENVLIYYLGDRLFARIAGKKSGNPKAGDMVKCIESGLEGCESALAGRWRDWGGMLLPGGIASGIIADLESGSLAEPATLTQRLRMAHECYDEYAWQWAARRWVREFGEATTVSVGRFITAWRKAVAFRHSCFIKDAAKEFAADSRIGFGVEDDADTAFRRVHGELSHHPLVAEAEAEKDRFLAMTESISQ